MSLGQILVLAVIFTATVCAGAGEMFLKMASDGTKTYWGTMVHPMMAYRLGVFVMENVLLVFAYKQGLPFVTIGTLQSVCYAGTICVISWHVFQERFDFQEILGAICCLIGIFLLMTSKKGSLSSEVLADSLLK